MQTRGKKLLHHLIQEGLVDSNGQLSLLPKIDPSAQQNVSAPNPGMLQNTIPDPVKDTDIVQQKTSQQQQSKVTNDKQNEDKKRYASEMEAGVYGLHLAEMHLNKLNEMRNEAEDIELDKLDGIRKVITDCRSQLKEMYDRIKV